MEAKNARYSLRIIQSRPFGFFLKNTHNAQWLKIESVLLLGQSVSDGPNLAARVCGIKRRALTTFVNNEKVFGKVEEYVRISQFQKRGQTKAHSSFIMIT